MKKLFGNLAGMALGAACAVYGVSGAPTDGTSWKAFGLSVILALLGNQIGLHQTPPSK